MCFLFIPLLSQHIHTLWTWSKLSIKKPEQLSKSLFCSSFFMVKFWQVSNTALKSSYRWCSIKKGVLKNLAILVEGLQAGNFITKTLQHRCFTVNIAKFPKAFYWTSVNKCFWTLLIQSGRYCNRKNRDAFKDNNRRRIQNPVQHLRWSFLQK